MLAAYVLVRSSWANSTRPTAASIMPANTGIFGPMRATTPEKPVAVAMMPRIIGVKAKPVFSGE